MTNRTIATITIGIAALVSLSYGLLLRIDDIYLYLVLSMVFAIIIGLQSGIFIPLSKNRNLVLKLALSAFIGGIAAYIWAVFTLFLLGGFQLYLVRALYLPFLPGWFFGAAIGLTYRLFVPGSSTPADLDREKYISNCIIMILSGSIIFGIILVVGALAKKEGKAAFLIPNNYTGPIVVVYDQIDGAQPLIVDDEQIFEIPRNGILLTQAGSPESVDDNFWYVDEAGDRVEKLFFNQNCVTVVLHF